MEKKGKWGIKGKVLMVILATGVIPGIVGLFLTYIGATNIMKQSIGNSFQELAIITAAKIDMIIEQEIHEVENLSITPLLVSYVKRGNEGYLSQFLTNEVANYLGDFMKLSPEEYLNIMVTDEKGRLVAAARRLEQYPQHSERWWQVAYNDGRGGVYISDIDLDSESSTYYIRISAPVMDRTRGKAIGVIAIDFKVEHIFKVILDIRVGATGHANLIDSKGTLIIDPLFPIMGLKLEKRLLDAVARDKPGWTVTDDDHGGKDAVLGFAPVSSTFKHGVESFGGKRWYVFTGLAPHETYAPIYSMLWRVSIAGLIMVGILSFLGYYVSSRLVNPIYLLRRGAELIGSGDLDHRLNIKTNDEIEELAEGFNQMAESLKKKISEQIRLEQQMAESEKLAAIGQLSAGIAHEIRNPLSSIKMSLDILSRRLKPAGNDKDRFNIAKKEVEHLEMLVQDVLYYAKPYKLNLVPGDVNKVLESSLKIVEDYFKVKEVVIIRDYCHELPMIPIDNERLKQAMLNIFLNSLQAMDSKDGGRLSIKTSNLLHSDRRMVRIEISDNGCGIKKENMKNIFNPFFTTKGDGTGLGLTNVKTIIDQHNGVIEVKSEEGEGTTFTIYLPVE